MDEQEQEVALHEARRIAVDPSPWRDLPLVITRALRIVLAELDRKAALEEDFHDGYVVGFGEGRDTTYPPDERRARLNELCRAHDLILARTRDPYSAVRELSERITRLRETEDRPVDETPAYHDPAHADAMRHSYEG